MEINRDPTWYRRNIKDKKTERGELMKQIITRLNPSRIKKGYKPYTMGRLGKMLQGKTLQDIYQIISMCNDADHRGIEWGAAFHVNLKPEKYDVKKK